MFKCSSYFFLTLTALLKLFLKHFAKPESFPNTNRNISILYTRKYSLAPKQRKFLVQLRWFMFSLHTKQRVNQWIQKIDNFFLCFLAFFVYKIESLMNLRVVIFLEWTTTIVFATASNKYMQQITNIIIKFISLIAITVTRPWWLLLYYIYVLMSVTFLCSGFFRVEIYVEEDLNLREMLLFHSNLYYFKLFSYGIRNGLKSVYRKNRKFSR